MPKDFRLACGDSRKLQAYVFPAMGDVVLEKTILRDSLGAVFVGVGQGKLRAPECREEIAAWLNEATGGFLNPSVRSGIIDEKTKMLLYDTTPISVLIMPKSAAEATLLW